MLKLQCYGNLFLCRSEPIYVNRYSSKKNTFEFQTELPICFIKVLFSFDITISNFVSISFISRKSIIMTRILSHFKCTTNSWCTTRYAHKQSLCLLHGINVFVGFSYLQSSLNVLFYKGEFFSHHNKMY